MAKAFLGERWGLPVSIDEAGIINSASHEESVRQSIWIILSTAKGERMVRPGFGCGIHDLVFESVTATTKGRVAQAVREALLRFERRIDVLSVQVEPDQGGTVLLISINYQVRSTNNVFNLVYPFYLERRV